MNLTVNLLLMVILFLAVVVALYSVFGAPRCDSLANVTAMQLKMTIDDVTDPNFPYWNEADSVPPDATYYEKVPIRLCQEQGEYSFIQAFFGGIPEYQIYFEKFPESGGGAWSEAYPWSGGSGGFLVFWGAMKGVTALYHAGKYVIYGKAKAAWIVGKSMKRLSLSLSDVNRELIETVSNPVAFRELLEDRLEAARYFEEFKGVTLIRTLKEYEAEITIDAYRKAGFIKAKKEILEVGKDDFKLVISSDLIYITVPELDSAGNRIRDLPVYVKKEGEKIVEATVESAKKSATQLTKEGYEELQEKPTDIFRSYLDMVSPEERDELRKIFALEDEIVAQASKIKTLGNKISKTRYFVKNFKPEITRHSKSLTALKTAGYKVDDTHMRPESVTAWMLTINEVPKHTDLYDNLIKPEISLKTRVADKIRIKLGLKTTDQITSKHVSMYASKLEKELSGFAFIPKDLEYNVHRIAIETLKEDATKNIEDIIPIVKDKLPDLYDDLGDYKVRNIIRNEVMPHVDELDVNVINFETKVNLDYLKSVSNGLNDADQATKEAAAKELGVLVGFLEQNTATLPVTFKSALAKGVKRESKKLIHHKAGEYLNPGSWHAKGIAMETMTHNCLGNSICLYSRGVEQEYPFYLKLPEVTAEEGEEPELVPHLTTGEKFSIRTWRPIEPWQQFAGIQAAIMQIPEHPRFHVVSPCFAVAKVWKTKYDGEDTVFVKPEKCSVDGSNYCYADNDLVNKFTAVWAVSDILSFMPYNKFFQTFKFAPKTAKLLTNVVHKVDPDILIQAAFEAAISWPGDPFKGLNYEEMQESATECGFEELSEELS